MHHNQLLLQLTSFIFISNIFTGNHFCVHAETNNKSGGCTDLSSFTEPAWLSDQYDQHIYIPTKSDSCNGMKFYWKIDSNDNTIQITAVAEASGWIGFGFSETGGMRGADIAYFTVGSEEVVDSHVKDGYVRPSIDDKQDWTLLNYELVGSGHLLFEVKRKLDSQDSYDRMFVDDSDFYFPDHNLIGAWGDSSDIMFHGNKVVQTKVQLFTNTDTGSSGSGYELFVEDMAKRSEGYVDLIGADFPIPMEDTWYETFCFPTPLSSEVPSTAYIVGYEWLIPPSLSKYIHHIVLETRITDYNGCYGGFPPFVAYTAGNVFFAFPDDSAIILSDASSLYGFDLQYHFDNSDKDNIMNSNSGIRLYYTSVPVTHEIGSFWSGDPKVEKEGDVVGNGLSVHKFECPSSCTETELNDDKVTVISESYHMHGKGKRAFNEILRDGKVIRKTAIDYWDFDQTGVVAVQEKSFELKKGDVISTSCYFETKTGDIFGLGTLDEMCMTLILYYPRQPNLYVCGPDNGVCSTSYESALLKSENELGRAFGYESGSDGPSSSPTAESKSMLSKANNVWIVFLVYIFNH